MDQSVRNKEKEKPADKRNHNPEQPLSDQSGKNSPITKHGENETNGKQRINWPNWILAISTIFIVFITFYYTYYARQQVEETRRAIALSEASLRLDQRAWMGVTYVSGKPETGKELAVTVAFKNTGKTPARNVSIVAVAEAAPHNKAPNFTTENRVERQSKGLVAPQAEAFAAVVVPNLSSPGKGLSDTQFKDIKEGKITIYAHGILEYDDVFNTHHWLIYCYYFGGTDRNAYNSYKERNDTDNN